MLFRSFSLKLTEEQKLFVSDPVRSLAQAYLFKDQCTPFGIYDGSKMVGYLLVIYDPDESEYNLWHVMIDRDYQNHGYGTAAVKQAIAYAETKPFGRADKLSLTCDSRNVHAYSMYLKLGFLPTGRMSDEETELAIAI